MKKIIYILSFAVCFIGNAVAGDLSLDTSDPLFLQSRSGLLSQTGLDYFETGLRMKQSLTYGLTDRFVFGGNVHFQQDFPGQQDGFSSIDLGGIYRLVTVDDYDDDSVIYDVLFGLKFGGSHRVRMPDYADSAYYVGLRFGRQYAGVTLAGTVRSTWIFDDLRGMAYIDFTPEIYFRVNNDWRMGGMFSLRKATNPDYDEETLGLSLVREYGRTQYVGHVDYAFEAKDVTAGLRINILF